MTLARLLRLNSPSRLSTDGRLRLMALLLFPALIGHIQLVAEDSPGTAVAMARDWTTPGWHLALPRWLVAGLFHFPHVAVMNVADYPMIGSTFIPALFRHENWAKLAPYLLRPSRVTLGGVVFGVAAQLWFILWQMT